MAKQQRTNEGQTDAPAPIAGEGSPLLESRAWELFAASVQVSGTQTHTLDHLASECFKAAAVFEAVAEQHKTKG